MDLTKNTTAESGYHRASIYLAAQNIAINIFKLESEGLRVLSNGYDRQRRELSSHNESREIHASSTQNGSETEIPRLRHSIYTNNEIIRQKNLHLHTLNRKLRQLEIMLETANKEPNYYKIKEIVDQILNDRRLLLVTALVAVLQTLKANPYGLNLLNSSPHDIEDYLTNDIDGKNLLQFAESCYDALLKSYVKIIT